MKRASIVAFLSVGLLIVASSAFAQIRSQLVASGLSQPLALVPDPLLPNVFYVVQQNGLVQTIANGQLQAEPFADLRGSISTGGERGLLDGEPQVHARLVGEDARHHRAAVAVDHRRVTPRRSAAAASR